MFIDKTIFVKRSVFRNMMDENDMIIRNKFRLAKKSYSQDGRINYEETYTFVVRLKAIQLFLAFDCCQDFKLYHMDVKFAFFNRFINIEVYVSKPSGFDNHENLDFVFKIK